MKKLKLLIAFIICLVLVGCGSSGETKEINTKKTTEASQKLFSFKDVGNEISYQGLSNIGIDYMFPHFSDDWSGWQDLGEDNRFMTNSKDTSKIFIIRNINVKDVASENFLKKLNMHDIRSYLEQSIVTYIGKTEETRCEINYVDQMIFFDAAGQVEHDQKQYQYRVVYFQSKLFQPSVFRRYVPTALFVLYENGKSTNAVMGMLETFKNNLIYQN